MRADRVDVAVLPGPVGDVLPDALRERVRRLEHHADALAQFHEVDALVVDFLAFEPDRAVDARGLDAVVHPVETPQKRRLPAARRADERRDAVLRDLHRDVLERVVVAVPDVEVLDRELRVAVELVVPPLVADLLLALTGRRLSARRCGFDRPFAVRLRVRARLRVDAITHS